MKVLVATEKPFAKAALESIRKVIVDAGLEFSLIEKYTQKSELLSSVSDANAIIIRSDIIDQEVVDAAKSLKIVVRAGAGYDNVDLGACTSKGVVVMNTPGQNSNAVAELVFGMLIYQIRKGFDGNTGTELRGKTIGIHGFGYIGKLVASIARGFGMEIHAYDPFLTQELIEKENVIFEPSIETLYAQCQYISIHIPANEKTKKSIGFELLNKMPSGATLINTARKEVIDEAGLLKMMEVRTDFQYVSDVIPDCQKEMEEKFKGRYLFTAKKSGAQTHEANNNAGIAAAKQIVNFFLNGDHTFQVNK